MAEKFDIEQYKLDNPGYSEEFYEQVKSNKEVINPNIIVVPMLKNVDETIVGIINKIENGLKMPPVRYKSTANWNKSYNRNKEA